MVNFTSIGSPVKFPILKVIPGRQLICIMAPAIIGKKTVFRIIYNPLPVIRPAYNIYEFIKFELTHSLKQFSVFYEMSQGFCPLLPGRAYSEFLP
jgi:hypothetical protein